MTLVLPRDVPPSVLFCLCADRLIPAARAGLIEDQETTSVPGPENTLVSYDLAPLLVAVAVWDLREQGLVRLEMGEARPLFGLRAGARWLLPRLVPPALRRHLWWSPGTWVRLTCVRHALLPGLEGVLLESLHAHEHAPLARILHRWLRTLRAPPYWRANTGVTPHQLVVHSVQRDALAWRVLDSLSAGDDGAPDLVMASTTSAGCAPLSVLEEQFAAASGNWQRFLAEEPAMAAALLRDCRVALMEHMAAVE